MLTKKWSFFKFSDNGREPSRANDGDLGYDLYASVDTVVPAHSTAAVPTGIGIKFSEEWGGIIHNRSSMSLKNNVLVGGGVIDNGYRGEIRVILHNLNSEPYNVREGDKIAQIIPKRVVNVEFTELQLYDEDEVQLLQGNTSRGANGFGSSGV